ncbi:amidase family protein [Solirubrobacter ginsenosidimutans]|uniref:Amidase family protein n=1 Tax=Solirubrobacter ginsenosidimutans TaxID=490573 RepID=A0A9X3RZ37_9ACTN|nr:amidase family protein [Solirubrobacter ginsenosidimutans]MDA0159779.1 amidase family protein [Solirubrobacter ginsenosidimutans]
MIVAALATAGLLTCTSAAMADPSLDLENLSGAQAEQMLQSGQVTSVQLVRAYEARIAAINKSGPGLNAVTQINPEALQQAADSDYARAHGKNLGPAMGLPILLKDIVDATPMYTSAGDWALKDSYPQNDSGVAKELKAHGVIILGKLGLSEWANSFGSQPSGFSNLTGQVLSAIDTAEGPSGSSSGSGAAAAASLAALTIGTETSGSIISPSTQQSDVGLRPTVGLVPGYGISPIDVSQDTAGPIVRTVSDAAITLQSIAEVPGSDPTANQEYLDLMGPNYFGSPATGQPNGVNDIPAPVGWNGSLPSYTSALDLNFVKGKRIGYNNATCTPQPCTPTAQQQANAAAVAALTAAGAIMVPDASTTVATVAPLPSGWEAHATIDEYYKGLGPNVPVKSLAQEVALDNTNPQEATKDGNSAHASESLSDDTTITNPMAPTTLGQTNATQFATNLVLRKAAYHSALDAMMNCPGAGVTTNSTNAAGLANGTTTCPDGTVNPVIAIIGSAPSTPQAGYPEMVVPMGYTTTQRRNIGVDVFAGPYGERDIIGVGYVIEQGTKLRKPVGEVDPASYRCARTDVPEPYAARGHCNPDYTSVMSMLGNVKTILPFPLETSSAQSLQAKLTAGTLTSQQLVKAELTRIALANANGPSVQAVRAINAHVLDEAAAADARRAAGGTLGPLDGIPVLVDDSISVKSLATSAGSIALQDNLPSDDAALVAKLKAAGAVILGDTNVTEIGGAFDTNMPQGYSSLGGQVLLPSDTNKSIGGSSAGSTAAVAAGFAPLAVGMETSTDSAQLITPAANAGVVALKPTVGTVSHDGVLPVATSQDAPGPVGQTVFDTAAELSALTGHDYTTGLSATALSGKKIAVIANTTAPYPAALTTLTTLGATTTTVTPGAATTAPSIVPYELQRDFKSLQSVIDYNTAHAAEGLKFGQTGLTAAAATTDSAAYATNLAKGKADSKAVLDAILAANSAILVPQGNALVNVADRAGYPVLTLPGGYGVRDSSTGADPIGLVLIGAAGGEAELLNDAYAFEQSAKVRDVGPPYFVGAAQFPGVTGAPSETNQSMWRCVEGSAFYHPYACNAGEIGTALAAGPVATAVEGDVGGSVPATLSLTLGAPASFGAFTPGIAKDYTASTTANVISTAGDAALTVSDPGHLMNGTFSLPSPLTVAFSKSSWSAPVSNDPVTITFGQHVGATDALRTGAYSKTLTFTLSTTTP